MMEDSSYMPPDLQSVHDIPKSNTLKAEQNGINADEHSASSIEKENLQEPSSIEGVGFCSIKSPPQQNGYHAEMEEGETHSGELKPQIEFEAAQMYMPSLGENGFISSSGHDAREEDGNGAMANSQEGMQEVTPMKETGAQVPVKIISHEVPAVNEGLPSPLETSNVVLTEDTDEDIHAVYHNTPNHNANRGDEDVISSEFLENSVESYLEEDKDGVGKQIERLDESLIGSSIPPRISAESTSENNAQSPLFISSDESRQQETEGTKEPDGDLEVPSVTSDTHSVMQNEVDLTKGEWPATMLISMDMTGWQRFDTEEVNDTIMDHTQGSSQRFELWEKLLDDGFDGHEREIQNPPLQLALMHSPFEESKLELASPGNPFVIEGPERVSSFSEADGFARNIDLPSSGILSQKESSSICWREGSFHDVRGIDDYASVPSTVDGNTNTIQLEYKNEHGSKIDLHLPSSRKPLASFDAMEPFEAPSFMSLVDPKSHALFEASMPTFQASTTLYGQENGGDKWVANFDMMAPSTQEITRSSSMPRTGADASGHHRPGKSFSFSATREQEPGKKESDLPHAHPTKSSFLSPKFSPVVQKVVDKVCTTPTIANGVLNSVRQAMSPKTPDKKSSSKSMLMCCMCW